LPRIGLLSDSHGHAQTTRLAVDVLLHHHPQILIHLGDVGTTEVIDALVVAPLDGSTPIQTHQVFGNTDYDTQSLGRYAAGLGIHVDHPVGQLDLGDRQLAFMHGHDLNAMNNAIDNRAAYLCFGHTHETMDQQRGSTRMINPGALCRAKTYTVALLDTDADHVTFYPVETTTG